MLARVKLEQDINSSTLHKLTINEMDFGNCACHMSLDAGEVPKITVKMNSEAFDFDGKSDLKYDFTPETSKQAVYVLRNELLKHGDIYNGFLASIESSVREQKLQGLPFEPERDIARKILDRLIGEE